MLAKNGQQLKVLQTSERFELWPLSGFAPTLYHFKSIRPSCCFTESTAEQSEKNGCGRRSPPACFFEGRPSYFSPVDSVKQQGGRIGP